MFNFLWGAGNIVAMVLRSGVRKLFPVVTMVPLGVFAP